MGIQCQNDMRHAKQFASKALDGNATLMPAFMQQDGGSILKHAATCLEHLLLQSQPGRL